MLPCSMGSAGNLGAQLQHNHSSTGDGRHCKSHAYAKTTCSANQHWTCPDNLIRQTLLTSFTSCGRWVNCWVAQAEDARLLGEFGVMKKMYNQLQHLNRCCKACTLSKGWCMTVHNDAMSLVMCSQAAYLVCVCTNTCYQHLVPCLVPLYAPSDRHICWTKGSL